MALTSLVFLYWHGPEDWQVQGLVLEDTTVSTSGTIWFTSDEKK